MDDAKEQLRLAVLREWSDLARDAGHAVPLDAELIAIARTAKLSGEPLSEALELWRTTVDWLLKQLRFGLIAPVAQLPNELRVPTPVTRVDAARQAPVGSVTSAAVTSAAVTSAAVTGHFGGPSSLSEPRSTDPKHELRRAVLRTWARSARAAGDMVPDDSELDDIARAATVGRDPRSVTVEAWRGTIEWLLRQLNFGVSEPEQQIPSDLRLPRVPAVSAPAPVPVPRAPSTAGVPSTPDSTSISPELTALRTWHASAVERNEPSISQLKDIHLRQIANSSMRTAAEITGKFGPLVGKFADDLAAALTGITGEAPSMPAAPSVPASISPPAGPGPFPGVHAPSGADSSAWIADSGNPPTNAEALDWNGFALYDFGPAIDVPASLRISRTVDGSVRVAWDTPPQPASYRVVSSDNHPPMSPDSAQRVAATLGSSAVDSREFVHAVRHFQVWRNDGATPDEARHSQPELHAFGSMVASVLDVDVREDEGRTIGQWRVLEGTHRVQVFRIPIRNAVGASGDPVYRILSDAPNLGGFVDSHPVRGEHYLYQVFAEALIDGISQLSAPVGVEMRVSVVHEPVLDLSFQLHDDSESPLFDLSWTNPVGGRVVVYRTKAAPTAGIERAAQLESVLELAGLTPDSRLAHPIAQLDGRSAMVDVPWPRDWTRAYFTAVVLQDDQAYVGNTVRGVRVPPVARPKLTERVNRQILTFEWPGGADAVQVFRSPTGMEPSLAIQGEAIEISESDYREKGGLSFANGTLGAADCDLHIVSVAFDGGMRVSANPVTVSYEPILCLSYLVAVKRTLSGKQYALVSITSKISLEHPPPFVLVHNPTRLPLTATDGTALAVERDQDVPGEPTRRFVPGPLSAESGSQFSWRTHQASWNRDVPRPSGFLRLFVALPPERMSQVALLDPPISSLRLMSIVEQAHGVFGG